MGVNRVILIGRLTKDVELRHTGGGTPVTDLSVAVNSREKNDAGEWVDRADFFIVTVWGNQAEACSQYIGKGSLIGIDGRLRQERWQNREGENRSIVKVKADSVQFLDTRESGDGPARTEHVPGEPDFGGAPDDDIPF